MKNKIHLLIYLLFVPKILFAQITLTSIGYSSSVIGLDSLKMTTFNTTFPSFAPAAPGMWDLSSVTDSDTIAFAWRVPVSGYQFADSSQYHVYNYSYQATVPANITLTGIFEYSRDVTGNKFDLYGITGSHDSLSIPNQIILYSNLHNKISLPVTYPGLWASNFYSDLNFEISYSALSLHHVPGVVRTYTLESDTVIGWGQMIVKDANGLPSSYFSVLQVKKITITIDSFFLNNAPAPYPVIGVFENALQGKRDTTYQQLFYRVNEITPLAEVSFSDVACLKPIRAATHVQRLVNEVQPVKFQEPFNVFPNPVNTQFIEIELQAIEGETEYRLVSSGGREIENGLLPVGERKIYFHRDLQNGVYQLNIYKRKQLIDTRKIEILK